MKMNEELERQAQTLVEESEYPVTVGYIARELHLAWGTARSILLSLALSNRIVAVRGIYSWTFKPGEKKGTPA